MSGLCDAGNPTQGFEHSRQALCQLRYISNLEEANSWYMQLCFLEIQLCFLEILNPTVC